MQKFGIFISARREDLGLTMEQVANLFGSTKQTIHNIESGKINDIKMQTLVGLAKALKLEVEDLVKVYLGKEPNEVSLSLNTNPDVTLAETLISVLKERGLLK